MIDATDEGPAPRALPKRPKTSARELLEPEEPALPPGPTIEPADVGSVVERRSAPEPVSARPAQVLPFPSSSASAASVAAPAVTLPARPLNIPVEKPVASPVVNKKKRDTAALSNGLARTRSSGFIAGLGALFAGRKELDPTMVEGLEKVLLTADIGVRTSQKLLEEIRSSLSRKELANPEAIWAFLRKRSAQLLEQDVKPIDFKAKKPFVLLTIGVNGSGKTTTIGKLAAKLVASGHKVLLAAGDTFRAAAAEQLEIWAGRTGATLVRGKEGADPSSVIFDAVKRGVTEGYDVVIADTAGRLHTKTDLMQELQKVRRVIDKASPGAPHETWLVIDSTSGQNAIAQAQIFTKDMQVSGIVLTKLDGTAKGGVILGIVDQLKLPVRYVGIGERVEDLREFDAEEFVEALFEPPSPSPLLQ
ncbi:MAG TPA: signal recognition particle-docking protein FtsY [Polyangia bacterium]|nr:signal recognition particle-docking protein FtsY [Polyangia bacterium]